MTEYEAKAVVIDRPVEDVWNFMLDISNMPKWEDGGSEWKQTSSGPINTGTTFKSSFRALRRQFAFDIRVTDFEPNRKFTVEALNGFGKGTKISYVMEPVESSKTKLNRVAEIRLHGFSKVLRPLQGLAARRAGRIEAENLKHLLEGQLDYKREDIFKR